MELFSKKKKQAVEVSAPESDKPAVTVEEEQKVKANVTRSTNNTLSDTRNILEGIIARLEHMENDTELQDKFKEVTDTISRGIKQRENDNEAFLVQLLGIQKGLFLTSSDRQKYWGYITYYKKEFLAKNSAGTISTGAYRLNKYALDYIESYEDALRSGRKLKANMCNKMLMYMLKSGYHKEDIKNPDELEKRMQHKENIVNKEGKDLIALVDTLYNLFAEHDAIHSRHVNICNEYVDVRNRLGVIPEKVKENIDSMGFKTAVKKLPANSIERKMYLPVLLHLSNMDATIRYQEVRMESKNCQIIQLYDEIKRVIGDIDEMMSISGTVMSHEEYDKKMNELNAKFSNTIAKAQQNVLNNEEREQKFASMINSFENNTKMFEKASSNLSIIQRNDSQHKELDIMADEIRKNSEAMKQLQEEERKKSQVAENLNKPQENKPEEMYNE